MGLESATYVGQLNSSNPAASDQRSQGDDHIRLVKATLLASFPAVTGAVTPTHTELNYVDGVTSAIQTQLDSLATQVGDAFNWTPIKTSDYTAAAWDAVPVDTSGGAFTVTMPASPGHGQTVLLTPVSTWTTNNPIVGRNGNNINGLAENCTLDLTVTIRLVFLNGYGWKIV